MSTKKESKETITYSPTSSISEQRHSVERALDETKDKIANSIDEAKREIPRNTQAINDYQEHTLQANKEIVDSYLESQKQIIQSFQLTWVPYIENTYGAFWNNWASPRRSAEIYARTISNFADNMMATTRIANNTLFANIDACKKFVQREKDYVKEFSRIAANTTRTFENTSKEFANTRPA
ncbi:MAG: hypothetical protein WA364_20950 [Candidatus Nitrosopolaris sp.]